MTPQEFKELREAATVMAGIQARQAGVLKEHAAWLQEHDHAISEMREAGLRRELKPRREDWEKKNSEMSSTTKRLSDSAEWAAQTAALIRAGQFPDIDAELVAEEIEDVGKREGSAVRSQLKRLLLHKLKQMIQPEWDCTSWRVSVESARQELRDGIHSSPSLLPYLQQNLPEIYRYARNLALIETGPEQAVVPAECPWTLEGQLGR